MVVRATEGGISVGGAPIGSDQWRTDESERKVKDAAKRIDSVLTLKRNEPHMAWRLLKTCANASLDYFARVVPPRILAVAARTFDAHMERARTDILTTEHLDPPQCSDTRTNRSRIIACLPTGCGGLGHIPLTIRISASYVATLMAASGDMLFNRARGALFKEGEWAHKTILSSLELDHVPTGHPLASVLPETPRELTEGGRAMEIGGPRSKGKVQGTIIYISMLLVKDELVRAACRDAGTEKFMKSDAAHILSLTTRSQLNRILSSSLYYTKNRMAAAPFRTWCRFYLNLPQQPVWNKGIRVAGFDCEIEDCKVRHRKNKHGHFLDPTGDHAAACDAAHAARYRTHSRLSRAIWLAAREAGLVAYLEPPTWELLLGQFSAEECRAMFPKSPTAETCARANEIQELLNKHAATNDAAGRASILVEIKGKMAEMPNDTQGRRIDVVVKATDGSEIWIDMTGIHLTTIGHRNNALKELIEEATDGDKGKRGHQKMSVSMAAAVKAKTIKYWPMVQQAEVQKIAGKRRSTPRFLVGGVTHTGEFSHGLFEIIEWLSLQVKLDVKRNPRRDGTSPAKAAGKFRMELKDTLATICAEG